MKFSALTQMKSKSLGTVKYADGQGLWLTKRHKAAGRRMLQIFVGGKRREMVLGISDLDAS